MTTTPNLPCPRCGAPTVPGQGPAGLCPACLMKMGLESRSGAPDVVFTKEGGGDRPSPPTIEELAPHFPELELREFVGRGGAGAVYRARQRSLQRDVALKVLTIAPDQNFAERFQREAHTLAGLSHPGIVSVFEYGQRGPWAFLVMEFVDGASLRQILRAREMGSREALSIVSQTCDALQYAHDHGVVHRDIKPENILVTRDGRVKVLDFGLAKLVGDGTRENLTREQQVMGTPHYMAPEQWEKPKTVDHRADIYALGVVFYELLTGELPIGRFAPPSHKVTLDVRLDDVVLRSLEKEPDRRYQHASEVKDAVTGIGASPNVAAAAAGVPVGAFAAASPPLSSSPMAKPSRSAFKVVAIVGGLGCLVLFLLAGGTMLFLGANRRIAADTAAEKAIEAALDAWNARLMLDGQEARKANDSLALSIDDDTPKWSEATAHRLGMSTEKREQVNAALEDVWRRYLALEASHLTFQPEGVDGLRVHVRPFATERTALQREAYDAIQRVLWTDNVAKEWEPTVRGHVDRMMRFGELDEIVHLRPVNGEIQATVERNLDGRNSALGDGGTGTVIFPVSAPFGSWVRRLWADGTSARNSATSAPVHGSRASSTGPDGVGDGSPASSSSPMEQRALALGLSETENGLSLSPRAAEELGLDPTRLSKLNSAWRSVFSAYTGLESRQRTFGPHRKDRIEVIVRAASRAREDLVHDAFEAIDAALEGNAKASEAVGVLRFHVERILRFGRADERMTITRDGDSFVVEELAPDGSARRDGTSPRTYRVPLPSWILRAWMSEFPFEPDSPLPR